MLGFFKHAIKYGPFDNKHGQSFGDFSAAIITGKNVDTVRAAGVAAQQATNVTLLTHNPEIVAMMPNPQIAPEPRLSNKQEKRESRKRKRRHGGGGSSSSTEGMEVVLVGLAVVGIGLAVSGMMPKK